MKILFLDTETGGFNSEKHSLLTLSLAVYNDGEIMSEKDFVVKHDDYMVTARALEINNINIVEHDKRATDSEIVVKEVIKFIKDNFEDEKPVIAGHNVEFDCKFLEQLFINEGLNFSQYISYKKIDTCSLINYLMITKKIDIKSAGLDACIKYFDIKTNSRHTAKDDVKATIELFKKINELIK